MVVAVVVAVRLRMMMLLLIADKVKTVKVSTFFHLYRLYVKRVYRYGIE